VRQLFIDCKKAYDSIRREVLYNTFIDTGIPMTLLRLINMCLNESYSRVRVGKNLSDMFLIRNHFKQEDALSALLYSHALVYVYAIRRVQINQKSWKLLLISSWFMLLLLLMMMIIIIIIIIIKFKGWKSSNIWEQP